MRQSDLADFGVPKERSGPRLSSVAYRQHISDEASLDWDSCPWCLEPAENFVDQKPGRIGKKVCPNCDSIIPVDEEWYQSGEKIVI